MVLVSIVSNIKKIRVVYKYTLAQLKKIAEDMADSVTSPCSIFLEGGLGAGKTTFSQFFIRKLLKDKQQSISSPTFNIVQIYDTTKGSIWHVDLYRIKDEREIFELGLLEAMHECICLIEWSQILRSAAFRQYIANSKYITVDLSV